MRDTHDWLAEITLTLLVFFFYFFCNTENAAPLQRSAMKEKKDMINSEFGSSIPGLSLDDQNRFYAEARREQSAAVAKFVGRAFNAVVSVSKAVVGAIVRGVIQARQLSELSHLSDRQLADIGIKRSDIPRIVLGDEPVGSHRILVPGLAGWTPSNASNDWRGSAAA